ncbi:MAG: hypothetical protein O2995_02110, partial [Proteobacteria bacterium]|nr:hypothetical protein [Pseudomonadota bacterium]
MMLIRCFLAPSKIEGIGLFARDAVAKGTEVYRFTPPFDLIVDTAAMASAATTLSSVAITFFLTAISSN